jgi:hypothetical protein
MVVVAPGVARLPDGMIWTVWRCLGPSTSVRRTVCDAQHRDPRLVTYLRLRLPTSVGGSDGNLLSLTSIGSPLRYHIPARVFYFQRPFARRQ